MPNEPKTTLAIPKTERPGLDMLIEVYRQEKHLASAPSIQDVTVYMLRECLERRGITFLPAPEGATPVPVVHVSRRQEEVKKFLETTDFREMEGGNHE